MTREELIKALAVKVLDSLKADYPNDNKWDESYEADLAILTAALAACERETWEEAAKMAEQEEEPQGDPPAYIRHAMDQAGVVQNVLAAVRATKHSIASACRARAGGDK